MFITVDMEFSLNDLDVFINVIFIYGKAGLNCDNAIRFIAATTPYGYLCFLVKINIGHFVFVFNVD